MESGAERGVDATQWRAMRGQTRSAAQFVKNLRAKMAQEPQKECGVP